jgi:succinate-acetate transporter protein
MNQSQFGVIAGFGVIALVAYIGNSVWGSPDGAAAAVGLAMLVGGAVVVLAGVMSRRWDGK